jgi:hypothetical protein
MLQDALRRLVKVNTIAAGQDDNRSLVFLTIDCTAHIVKSFLLGSASLSKSDAV